MLFVPVLLLYFFGNKTYYYYYCGTFDIIFSYADRVRIASMGNGNPKYLSQHCHKTFTAYWYSTYVYNHLHVAIKWLCWQKISGSKSNKNTNQEPLFLIWINSLGPSDAIWRWRSWSVLVQVMAPSHYLNQCWLIISKVLWHSFQDIIMRRFEDTNQ